ncbi:hypothetical protein [Paraburkholderia acidisoli]|uniref:Uncharacterized protein n=1 Tax=Paraburkholderia acidisoli TaxID=2571748 RepID=A0A7Z2JKG2_9BURK|nr:hypothetical protein [Paraburkholderia acidisoli]QGZ66264.1 hypothetical protein FAZ98_31170 [Paraburkholderia acidisoli]QGZ66352.1 hypothetical protein FAZ98_31665 [Paraburkholderia acidisoli]
MSESHSSPSLTHESLCALSHNHLVIVLFVNSRSAAFDLAIDVAKRAPLFEVRDLESIRIYAAGFARSFEGAILAMDLIHYVRGWKGTHFYARGRMVIGEMKQAYDVEAVLQCFMDSCKTDDWRAHCQRTIDSPYFPIHLRTKFEYIHPMFRHITAASDEGNFLFPCSYMLQWFEAQPDHPSSVTDQIQAEGVAKMCDICPRFNPNDFQSLREEK